MKRLNEIHKCLSSLAIAGYLFVMILHIVHLLEPVYLITINRVTILQRASPFIISPSLDVLLLLPGITTLSIMSLRTRPALKTLIKYTIPLICLTLLTWWLPKIYALVTGILSILVFVYQAHKFDVLEELLCYFMIIYLGLEVLALSHWILISIVPLEVKNPLSGPVPLETGVFYTLHKLSIALIIILIYMWLFRKILIPLTRIRGIKITKKGISLIMRTSEERLLAHKEYKRNKISLLIATIVSSILSLYPYSPAINPNNSPVTVDIIYYSRWLSEMKDNPWQKAFILSSGSRPIVLLLLYLIEKLIDTNYLVITHILLSLAIITYPLVTYYLVRKWRFEITAMAVMIAPLSIYTLVGIYAGYHANLLALNLAYVGQSLFIEILEEKSVRRATIVAILLIVVALSHTWTWQMSIAVMAVYLVLSVIKHKVNFKRGTLVFLQVTAPSVLVDLARSIAVKSLPGVSIGYRTLSSSLSFDNLMLLGQNLSFALNILVGGYTANWLLYTLAVIGALALNYENPLDRLLDSWLITTSIPFLFSNATIQSRLILNLPLHILAAKGLYQLTWNKSYGKVLTTVVFFVLTTHTLRSLANMIP